MRSALIVVLVALFAGVAGYATYRLLDPGGRLVGQPAPEVVLRDTEGREHALSALRGRVVLVNFWASWCAPCMEELPLLVEMQQRYGERGLQILGPALDDADAVAPVVARFGINYPVMPDFVAADNAMVALGNDRGALPYSVLIDREGRIADVMLGAYRRAELEALLAAHLGR